MDEHNWLLTATKCSTAKTVAQDSDFRAKRFASNWRYRHRSIGLPKVDYYTVLLSAICYLLPLYWFKTPVFLFYCIQSTVYCLLNCQVVQPVCLYVPMSSLSAVSPGTIHSVRVRVCLFSLATTVVLTN